MPNGSPEASAAEDTISGDRSTATVAHQPLEAKAHIARPWAAALTIAVAVLFVLLVPLASSTLNAVSLDGLPLGYYLAAQGGLLLVASLGLWLAGPWRNSTASERFAAFLSSMTATGRWLSAGVLMTLIGTLFVHGHDGLPVILGLGAGLLVSLVFVAPALDKARALHADELIGRLTGSIYAAAATGIAMTASLLMLLSIEIEVAGLAASAILKDTSPAPVMLIGAIAATAVMASLIPGRSFWYGAIAAALVVTAGGLWLLASWLLRDAPMNILPPLAYGPQFAQLGALERTLLLEGLADPVTMPPFGRPFVQLSALNFACLTISVLLGAAVLPHMLWRRRAIAGTNGPAPGAPHGYPSRQKAALGLVLTSLVITSLPVVAVLAKVELYRSLAAGIEKQNPPEWLNAGHAAGYLRVCPQAQTAAIPSSEEGEAAQNQPVCGDPKGRLRIPDVAINPAAVLLLVPGLAGLGEPYGVVIAGLIALLAVLAAAGTLRLISEAATSWIGFRPKSRQSPITAANPAAASGPAPPARLLLGVLFAGLAVATVVGLAQSPVDRLYWGFSILGASVLPMLMLSAIIPRIGGVAVALGGLTGLLLALYYMIGTTSIFAPQFADYWSSVSDAPPWLLDELRDSLRACAADGSANTADCSNALQLGRELANWFGIDGRAAATIAAPLGIVVALLTWLLTPSFWRKAK
ncbi:MAG: hypothetical protein K0U74_13270 [Alphaproteobacteria bacterium]|nr:hypothetical protein [Alphaproteobacteria bacterium]